MNDVLSFIDDPAGNKQNSVGTLTRTFFGDTSSDWMNLSGQLLTDYNTCKAAETIYKAALAAWVKYNTDLDTWNIARQGLGCAGLVAPPLPTYQTPTTDTGQCADKANAAVTSVNTRLQSAYNTANTAYTNTNNACNALTRPLAVVNPGTFTPSGLADATTYSGFDGEPQPFMLNATGLESYRNVASFRGSKVRNATGYRNVCAPCALAALAADGDPAVVTTAGASLNWVTILMLVGVTALAYKVFIIKK